MGGGVRRGARWDMRKREEWGKGFGGYPIDNVLTDELGESKDKQMYTQAGNA